MSIEAWFILISICVVILLVVFFRGRKVPKCGSLCLITGGVKTGKSTLSIHLVIRQYKHRMMKWRIRKVLSFVFRFMPYQEKPVLYSNVPLAGVKYSPVTEDLLLRRTRFAYRSVVYIQEASLVESSQYFKNADINERLLLLNKLIAHETRGGCLYYDTQSIQDCHFSIKRSLSNFLWIHHCVTWIPFFCVVYLRELFYSEDNSTINTFDSDVEDTLKRVIVPKSVWKRYDCYCYSALTDHLPVSDAQLYHPRVYFFSRNKAEKRRALRSPDLVRINAEVVEEAKMLEGGYGVEKGKRVRRH